MANLSEATPLPSPPLREIDNMCERRNRALALVESGLRDLFEAKRLAPEYAFIGVLQRGISWYGDDSRDAVRQMKLSLDRYCWTELLDKSKLGLVMNSKQLDQVRSEIQSSTQELTRDVAVTTFMELCNRRYDTFREGLVDVFTRLSGKYRSHSPFKVGRRIILTSALWGTGWNCYRQRDAFNDLWSYCCLLDGVDPTAFNRDETPAAVLNRRDRTGRTEYTFEYFRVKTYENGNLHIWLDQRPDLLNRINALIAEHYGATLPQERAAR